MKKFAALALLATAAAAANAQSSVTMFGVVDLGVRHVKNGDNSLSSLNSGGVNNSRLGVRGIEDLGGGLSAGFWLEHGFNADTGAQADASRFWGRRATVSLMGGFGELRLGRDYTPTYGSFADFDVFGDTGLAAAGKFNSVLGSGADTATRADNQATYFLPKMGGVYGQVSVAAGEGTAGKKYAGGRLGYAAGPLNVSLAYGNTDVAPVGGADKFKTFDLGASYNFGVVKVSGYYQQNKFANLKLVNYNIGATVPVGTTGEVRASFINANASGTNALGANVGNNDAKQFALGYVHWLSKRTSLYGTVARINNDAGAAYLVGSSPALASPNTGKDSTGYEFGLRHAF